MLAPFSSAHAQPDAAAAFDAEIAAQVAGPQVTVVHFWAPWCANCQAEMVPSGWAAFIAANPDVQFVFLNVWHRGQNPAPRLAAGALGTQPNLLLRTHPNPASKGAERVNAMLGLPITWLPTTWVFQAGRLRYALNYGEVRFAMLQQMIDDTRATWKH